MSGILGSLLGVLLDYLTAILWIILLIEGALVVIIFVAGFCIAIGVFLGQSGILVNRYFRDGEDV